MQIRTATNRDRDDIHNIHWAAFPEGEREVVSRLAVNLLSEETTPVTISLVAESGGAIVGHVAFSPVTADGSEDFRGYILAPLAVLPDYHNRGIGSKLIESGRQQLSGTGAGMLFVYGDPEFYGRFGFSVDAAERYIPPYSLQYPAGWQGMTLNESHDGESSVRISCVPPLCDPSMW